MADKGKPKWGYRSLYLFGRNGEGIYSPEFIADLVHRYAMGDRRDALKVHLEGVAHIYRATKNNDDEAPRASDVRAALHEIYRLSSALEERLGELDDFSLRALWGHENAVEMEATIGEKEGSRFGHTYTQVHLSEKERVIIYLRRQEIEQGIGILRRYAEDAIAQTLPDTAGAPHNQAVRIWASNMENWWSGVLGRPFTLDYQQGVGVTPAFRFSWDALQPLDPSVTQANLITAMRYIIKRSRRMSGKNTPAR